MLICLAFTFVQGTTRAVFKGLQDLLKYLLLCVEEELQKESEANIFSVFLILRLAFSIHLPPPAKQKTGGSGLSFFSSLFGSDDAQSRSKVTEKGSVEMKNVIGSDEKSVEACDGGSKTDSLEAKSDESSEQENGDVEGDRVLSGEGEVPLKEENINLVDIHKHLLYQANGESDSSSHSLEFEDPLTNVTHNIHDGSPVRTIGSPTSAFSPTSELQDSRVPSTHPVATPPATPTSTGQLLPQSRPPLNNLLNGNIPANLKSREKIVNLSPARAAQDALKGSPLRKGRAVSPSHLLLLELLESPRLYHPNETGPHRLAGCVFLYKEVMKSLGSSKSFLLEKKFWDVLFMSTISTDRNQLGWNEKTTELYTR